ECGVSQRYVRHHLASRLRLLVNGKRDFASLAVADTDLAATVADVRERRETELTSALHDLRDAIDRHELLDELVRRCRFLNSGHCLFPVVGRNSFRRELVTLESS